MYILCCWKSVLCVLFTASLIHLQLLAQGETVFAGDAEQVTSVQEETCSAPTDNTSLQKDLDSLQKSYDNCMKKFESSVSECSAEKTKLEKMLLERGKKLAADEKSLKKLSEDVERLQTEVKDKASELKAFREKNKAMESQLKTLKEELEDKKISVSERETRLKDLQKDFKKQSQDVKELKHEILQSKKSNDALKYELENRDHKVTLATLLSAYYDQGFDRVERVADIIRANMDQVLVSDLLKQLRSSTHIVAERTKMYYVEFLADLIDPMIAHTQKSLRPHIKMYKPLLQKHYRQASSALQHEYHTSMQRVKALRITAIQILHQNKYTKEYAHLIVDISSAFIAIPCALFAIRYLFALLWWCMCTLIYVLFCCACCGRCAKKRNKIKRKSNKRAPASSSPSSRRPNAKKMK